MIAIHENLFTNHSSKVWMAHFKNLQNIPHWHDAIELVFCESQNCRIQIDETLVLLKKNETAIIESGKVHSISCSPNGTVYIIIAENSLFKGITDKFKLKNAKQDRFIDIPCLYKFFQEQFENNDYFSPIILHSKIIEFVADIFRNNKLIKNSDNDTSNKKYQLSKKILNYIEENYVYVTFEEMAKNFGYTPAHFSRLFTNMTGMTFTTYLNVVKTEHAINEIKSHPDKNITSISIDCGFSSIRNFNRIFKKLTGYTPSKIPNSFALDELKISFLENDNNPTQKNSIILDN